MHPFCVVDCGSIPANLIESELFGHERGAFTGAVSTRKGVFERAQGGVVFLDEIGELPLQMQTRLLRVLEQRVIKRVGSSGERAVDFRVIAATNRNLRQLVEQRQFREDLYFRLVVVRITNPPLRDRVEDIPLLARHFLWQSGCPNPDEVLTPEVLEVLTTRQWPGNVRELRNAVERAVLFTDGLHDPFDSVKRMVELRDGPHEEPEPEPGPARAPGQTAPDAPWDDHWLDRALPHGFLEKPYKVAKELLNTQFELSYLKRLLKLHGRNISRIAFDAGIDRHMVRKLMRKHGFDT
jgi:DNA-binding NtrC family response regulator